MIIENYRLDGEPRALYYAQYRDAYLKIKGVLTPGEEVPADSRILFVGNNGILPTSFDLRSADRQNIGEFRFPGKSAHVFFTDNCDIACGAIFDRPARRTDHLYTVKSDSLVELGFHTFYLPLPNLPLHLRVVHLAQLNDPLKRDIPYSARIAIASLLQQNQIC